MGRGMLYGLALLTATSGFALSLVRGALPQSAPPADHERKPRTLTTDEVRQQIERSLRSEPALAGTSISVTVDDNSVLLSGGVYSEQQHDLALRIAESYAGDRKIVDRISLRYRT